VNRALWKDLGFALLIGVLFGLSPHTSAGRTTVKIAGGILIGVAVLGVRLWSRRGGRAAEDPPPGERVPALAWAVLALTGVLFLPAAGSLFRHFTEDIWTNGHGLFVPVVSFLLAAAILRRDPSREPESTPWGWLPLGLGLGLLVIDAGAVTIHLSVVGLVLLLLGLSLLLLGPRRTRSLAFPILLLLFLIPLPTSLAMPLGLNQVTAAGTAAVFNAFGSPAVLSETVIERPYGLFGVSAHCSGFSAFYAALVLACVLGWASGSWKRTALLLLAVWPVAALASIVRTVLIVMIWESVGPRFHATPWHGLSGIAAFWGVVFVFFLLADRRALRERMA
jgi:exosortase